jgi:hypothetical protein
MNNTKEATRQALKLRAELETYYNKLFCNLFHNSIEIENLPRDLPKRYILNVLYEEGQIAYDYLTQLYLRCNLTGVNQYGLPTRAILLPAIGSAITRKIDDVCVLRVNDLSTPIKLYIQNNIRKLIEIDIAMYQNIEATKVSSFIGVDSQSTLLSLINMQNARQIGASVVYVDKTLATKIGETLKAIPTNAQYMIDKFIIDREKVLNETFTLLGIGTANIEKRERVQGVEVLASQSLATDCINIAIDTFNYDAKFGNLAIRLKAHTNLMKINDLQMQVMKDTEKSQTNTGVENND